MNISIGFLIIGALAGAIGGRIADGRGFGCLGNIIVGVIGSFLGGYLFQRFSVSIGDGFWGSLITATVGAVIFLTVLNIIKD